MARYEHLPIYCDALALAVHFSFPRSCVGTHISLENFLGFTHYVGKSRQGRFKVGPTTQSERIAKKLKEVGQKLARLRVQGGKAMMDYARQHLRGHLAYYAVSDNTRQIGNYAHLIGRLLFKWLNRRSQKRS